MEVITTMVPGPVTMDDAVMPRVDMDMKMCVPLHDAGPSTPLLRVGITGVEITSNGAAAKVKPLDVPA